MFTQVNLGHLDLEVPMLDHAFLCFLWWNIWHFGQKKNSNFACTAHGIGCGVGACRCNRKPSRASLKSRILYFMGKVEPTLLALKKSMKNAHFGTTFLK